MLAQRHSTPYAAGAVRRQLPRARVTTRAAGANWQSVEAGQLIYRLNEEALSKSDPRVRRIKTCVDEAVRVVLDGHATVQLQGSVSKGTSTAFGADIDTFVRHMGVVTHEQRGQLVQHILANFRRSGITCKKQRGENRIWFREVYVDGESCTDVDVVFNQYKSHFRGEPNDRKLADSPLAQQTVRYIKRLPDMHTKLSSLKGMAWWCHTYTASQPVRDRVLLGWWPTTRGGGSAALPASSRRR